MTLSAQTNLPNQAVRFQQQHNMVSQVLFARLIPFGVGVRRIWLPPANEQLLTARIVRKTSTSRGEGPLSRWRERVRGGSSSRDFPPRRRLKTACGFCTKELSQSSALWFTAKQ